MPQSSSAAKKHGSDQLEASGPTPKSQRTKMVKSTDDPEKKVTPTTPFSNFQFQQITHGSIRRNKDFLFEPKIEFLFYLSFAIGFFVEFEQKTQRW